jgi:hypothetical protein
MYQKTQRVFQIALALMVLAGVILACTFYTSEKDLQKDLPKSDVPDASGTQNAPLVPRRGSWVWIAQRRACLA